MHHDEDSGRAGFLRGFFVDNFLLHPHSGNLQLNGLIDDLLHKLRPSKKKSSTMSTFRNVQ